jgi:hypothetical protein
MPLKGKDRAGRSIIANALRIARRCADGGRAGYDEGGATTPRQSYPPPISGVTDTPTNPLADTKEDAQQIDRLIALHKALNEPSTGTRHAIGKVAVPAAAGWFDYLTAGHGAPLINRYSDSGTSNPFSPVNGPISESEVAMIRNEAPIAYNAGRLAGVAGSTAGGIPAVGTLLGANIYQDPNFQRYMREVRDRFGESEGGRIDDARRAVDDALRIARKYANGGSPEEVTNEGEEARAPDLPPPVPSSPGGQSSSFLRSLISHIGGSGQQGLLLRENEGAAPSIAPYEAIKGAVSKAAAGADPAELVPDVTDAALAIAVGGSPISRPANSLGIFGGMRQAQHLAEQGRPAALDALRVAGIMEHQGASHQAIRRGA